MDPECTCGHGGSRHHEEQPYPCHECDCRAFTISGALSMSAPRPEGLTLKWGTLKGWDLDDIDVSKDAAKKYVMEYRR